MCIIYLHGEQQLPFLLLMAAIYLAAFGFAAYAVYKIWRRKP